MNLGAKYIGLAGLCLLGSLAVASPALAETMRASCLESGGDWHGQALPGGEVSDNLGTCTYLMIVSDPGLDARARAQRLCTNVGGRVSQRGGKQFCSVSGANIGRVNASAEFRSATRKR